MIARSYKDKLLGEIPRAFEQAFGLSNDMEEDAKSNTDEDKNVEGNMVVYLMKEEKTHIRAVWRQALIIKPFERKMGFNYLYFKIRSMWNLAGKMEH